MRRPQPWRGGAIIIALGLFRAWPAMAEEADYLPDSSAWTGTSELAALSSQLGVPLALVQRLDWSQISEHESLFVLYPRADIDPDQIRRFLRRGGRVLIADDFGRGEALFAAFGISRQPAGTGVGPLYADRPGLPIAVVPAGTSHPLTRGIRSIVTNHPAVMRSSQPTLVGFGDGSQLLVTLRVGAGRLVVLSDPSVLINGMLAFQGNALLARHLIEYLTTPKTNRVLLFTGYVQQAGKQADAQTPEERAGRSVNLLLERANDFALTGTGMSVVSFVLGGLLILVLARFLPIQRKDLDGHWLRPGLEPPEPTSHQRIAGLYREQLELDLAERLGTQGPLSTVDPRWAVDRCRRLAGEEAAVLCRKLLAALRQVPFGDDPHPRLLGPSVSARDLAAICEYGESLTALLRNARTGTPDGTLAAPHSPEDERDGRYSRK